MSKLDAMQSKILDKIKLPIQDLKELQGDFKKLGKKQFQKLKNSIEKNGFIQPFFVWLDKGTYWILDGHQRKKAIIDLYGDIEVDCLTIQAKSLQEAKKLCIFYSSSYADFDKESLLEFAEGLNFEDVEDFQFPTFNLSEGDFLAEPDEKDDHIPEVAQNELGVQLGDVYTLGNHRLMCGDSTDKETVEKLMDGHKADITFTSPPYNANAKTGDGDIFNKKKSKKMYADGYNDNQSSEDYVFFVKKVLEICFQFTKGYIFWNVSYNANSRFEYIKQIEDRIDFLIEQICWKKTSTIPFKGSFMRDWEPIYVFSTEKESIGVKKVTSNHWEISNTGSQQENHKACFPVLLPEKALHILPNAKNVFDPFLGSGSTLIACEKTNRNCYMMELDPHYCSVIIKRWEEFTGKKAVKNA